MFKCTAFCTIIHKTLRLILRCAAPLWHMLTIYYKDYGALHLHIFFGSTILNKYCIQSGRAAQYL